MTEITMTTTLRLRELKDEREEEGKKKKIEKYETAAFKEWRSVVFGGGADDED